MSAPIARRLAALEGPMLPSGERRTARSPLGCAGDGRHPHSLGSAAVLRRRGRDACERHGRSREGARGHTDVQDVEPRTNGRERYEHGETLWGDAGQRFGWITPADVKPCRFDRAKLSVHYGARDRRRRSATGRAAVVKGAQPSKRRASHASGQRAGPMGVNAIGAEKSAAETERMG